MWIKQIVRHALHLFALLALAAIGIASPVQAAAQRMGIGAGTYRLSPHGSTTVPAFCFDYTRESPSTGNSLDTVLTDTNSAIATVGDRRMPLQEAIAKGLVRVNGTQGTLADLIHAVGHAASSSRMPLDQRLEAQRIKAKWDHLTASQRAGMEAEFALRNPQLGSHTRLNFSSNSDQPVAITFANTAILGTAADRKLAVPDLQVTSTRSHDAEQEHIWTEMNQRNLSLLSQAGYGSGAADLKAIDPHALAAVFQRDHNLPVTGQFDPLTEKVLVEEGRQGAALKRINSRADRRYSVLYVSPNRRGVDGGYRVSSGFGLPRPTTTIDEMMRVMHGQLPVSTERVYLVPRGMSDEEIGRLAASAQIYSRFGTETRPTVGVLKVAGAADEVMFKPIADIAIPDEIIQRGTDAAITHEILLTVKTTDGGSRKIKVVSKIRNLLERFIANLQALMSHRTYQASSPTPAQILALALEQTRREAHMTHQQMADSLSLETANVQFGVAIGYRVPQG